jgi:hypothetical protein
MTDGYDQKNTLKVAPKNNKTSDFFAGLQKFCEIWKSVVQRLTEYISKNRQKIKYWVDNFPPDAADSLKKLVLRGLERGWYLNEVFLYGLISGGEDSGRDLDAFIEKMIVESWDEFWNPIIRLNPSRESLLNEAKKVFESEYYASAIHLFYTQADGVFKDKFNNEHELFGSRGDFAKKEFKKYLSELVCKNSLNELLRTLCKSRGNSRHRQSVEAVNPT